MITRSVFNNLPASSQSTEDGKRYTLASDSVGATNRPLRLYWYQNQNDQTARAEIQEGSQVMYSYEEGDVLPRKMPQGLQQRIVDDYNALLGKTDEERAEEDATPTDTTTTVREETVGDFGGKKEPVVITMTRTDNSLDIRAGEDKVFYTVSDSLGRSSIYDTQEEAEEAFERSVGFYSSQTLFTVEEEYRGVQIRFQDSVNADGSDGGFDAILLNGEGINEEFMDGDSLSFRDSFGVQDFGTIDTQGGSAEQGLNMLKAYIDARLDGRENPEPFYGILPLYSWGWYRDNEDNEDNPFSEIYLENVYTVSETNGRILGLTDDDFIAQGIESGLAKFKVKPGYRVRLKLMTQKRGFLEDNIPNLDSVGMDFETYNLAEAKVFGQSTNYTDTEKVKIDLFGGDELEINIDGIDGSPSVKTFYITQNGTQITSGGGQTINDETFLAVIEVERLPPSQSSGGGGGGSTTEPGQMNNAIPILIGGGLIIAILYMVLARGDSE